MARSSDDLIPEWEDVLAEREGDYEESVVKRILSLTKMTNLEARLRGQDQQLCEGEMLTVYRLIEDLGFPAWLVPKRFKRLANLIQDLQHRPTKSETYEGWEMAAADMPPEVAGSICGVVFNWPHFSRHMVFHDSPAWPNCSGGLRFSVHVREKLFVVESLEDFIKGCGAPSTW